MSKPFDSRCVHEILDNAARLFPVHEAVRDDTGTWTYEQLHSASRIVAQRLTEAGVQPDDRVVCLAAGSRDFAALLYGVSRCGAVLVPCAEETSDYQLRWLVDDAKPALVVTAAHDTTDRSAYGVPTITIDVLGSGAPAQASEVLHVDPDATALLIYTSGTTARPKGIVCPHRTVTWTAESVGSALGYRETDVVYNRLPVSFDYGLYQILLCALAGAALVFGTSATVHTLHALHASRATVVPVVPTLAALLCRLTRQDSHSTSVRMITNTGASLVGADAARVRTAFPGAGLVCMYGMSECKRITIAAPDEDLAYPGTVGRPIPGTRLFVLDDNGSMCPAGEIGQIVAAGPHVMAGYWRAPEATAERFVVAPDGDGMAVRTGDYGYVDEAGRLYFVGRRDDLFKRRGWRLSTQEIEYAARDVPGVFAAACLPPAADGALTVWAEATCTPTELIRGIAERLGPAKAPDHCVIVDRLPQTPNGKIDKNAMRSSVERIDRRGS